MSVHIIIKNSHDNKQFEKSMRIFKRACQKQEFLQEARERRYYLKPSEKKKFKKDKARRRKGQKK